jgi:hypothetical protein
MKPVKNADIKPTTRATFSDMPWCTKSGCMQCLIQCRIAIERTTYGYLSVCAL